MASKKYTLIVGLLCLIQSASFAQNNDATYDWSDSSKISSKLMPQHNEFMNNQYPYPAKPKSMWELGLQAGVPLWIGDVSPRVGYGGGVSLRKALGHVLSLRAQYNGGFSYGLDYKRINVANIPSDGTTGRNPWTAYNAAPNDGLVPLNYRNRFHQGSLDMVVSLNTISHYSGNPKANWYVFGGYSLIAADVDVDAVDGTTPHNFSAVNYSQSRSDIRSDLKDLLDDEYESNAPVKNGNRDALGRIEDNWLLRHGVSAGAGVSLKLSNKVNIGLEQRYSTHFDDNMDGYDAGTTNEILSMSTARLNINIGSSSKKVQPLWWLNPNNFIYNELNRPQHMQLPKPVLPDADNDGVTDQFDLEPNTPAGCPVDSHGVSRDSDGDGVPDCRDKELLTAQNCFPVNADGVGNCPEPPCCRELRDKITSGGGFGGNNTACSIASLPSVQFRSGSVSLSKDAQSVLQQAAAQIKSNTDCRVKVVGYGASDKRSQQLSWDRVNAVIKYLVETQGISEDRFIFSYGQGDGDANTVDLQPTTEEGPNTVPAPHPNLKKSR